MSDKTTDVVKNNQPNKKHKLLFVVSILVLIDSVVTLALTALIFIVSTIAVIFGEISIDINISSLLSGVSIVFGAVLAAVAFYAAVRGIWQNKLIKCRKLGIVLILLSSVSYVSNLFGVISIHDSIQSIIFQIILYAILSLLLPILYLIGANLALKKQEPKSKYESIIETI